jgi:pyridoxal phosphate enzyme (YggS family)
MSIKTNLQQVHNRISKAAQLAKRSVDAIALLAVSKNCPVEKIKQAIDAGQTRFGENYLQEALPKISALKQYNLEWHFIGAIQSNKIKLIAENFSWVQSVDREKIIPLLAQYRPSSLPLLNICIQVNIDQETTKAGARPEEVLLLAKKILEYPDRLKLRGLMAIPKASSDAKEMLASFNALRDVYQSLQSQGFSLNTLSMGMSADLELAIHAGSTLVRVGTAIFGER